MISAVTLNCLAPARMNGAQKAIRLDWRGSPLSQT
jgi:hypothetical protein